MKLPFIFLVLLFIELVPLWPVTPNPTPVLPPVKRVAQAPKAAEVIALDLIRRQQYAEAITRLEQILESNPNNGEALTYLATANLYNDLNFSKAKKEFEKAFKAGGGATFFVSHSHEKLSTDEIVDYCRGWLHLRKGSVEFIPIEGNHGFKVQLTEVVEFKQNRFSKTVFHIKVGEKNQNFRGRSVSELEPLLILAVYKNLALN
jgi:tetratricopeptide (TPR) repeat protein